MKIFRIIFLIFFLMAAVTYKVLRETHRVSKYPTGQIAEEVKVDLVQYLRGQQVAQQKSYYPGGQVKFELTTINGRKEGLERTFYESGKPEGLYEYKNNLRNGRSQWFAEDGQKSNDLNFKDNQMHGLCKWYKFPGQLELAQEYANGLKHGLTKWYFDNGGIHKEIFYQNNLIHGTAKFYDMAGQLEKEQHFEENVLQGVTKGFYSDGVLSEELPYKNGVLHGEARYYYHNGKVKLVEDYKNNKKNGRRQWFYKDGSLIADMDYREDKIISLNTLNDGNETAVQLFNDLEEKDYLQSLAGLLLVAKKFDKLEQLTSGYRANKSLFASGSFKLNYFYGGLSDGYGNISWEEYLGLLKEWEAQYPHSITQRVVFLDALIQQAWSHRGSGFASTVTDGGYEKFNKTLLDAATVAETADSLDVKDPELYVNWLTIAKGLGFPKEEIYAILEKGQAVDPTYYPLYNRVVEILLPRWYGEAGDMEKFMAKVIEQTQELTGYEMYARMADELRVNEGENAFLFFKLSWPEIKEGFSQLKNKYPKSFYLLNSFAWYSCHFQDREIAADLLKTIGQDWNDHAQGVWGDKEEFAKWKKWALNGEPYPGTNHLHQAAIKGDISAVAQLLKEGADINATDVHQMTALHYALQNYHEPAALFLINANSRIDIRNNQGEEPIHLAAGNGFKETVKLLLGKGAQVNVTDYSNWSPLHHAASSGRQEIVRLLLDQKDVLIDALGYNYQTALHRAVWGGYIEVVNLLLSKGANINSRDIWKNTPLHNAAIQDQSEVISLLIDKGAEINARNSKGKTPFNLAVESNHPEAGELLKKLGGAEIVEIPQ